MTEPMQSNSESTQSSTEKKGRLTGIEAILHAPLPLFAWLLPSSVMVLMLGLLVWMSLSRLDIINQATGEIVTSDPLIHIQPQALERVDTIWVRNGDAVKKGQLLVTFNQDLVEESHRQVALEVAQLSEQLLRTQRLLGCLQEMNEKNHNCLYTPQQLLHLDEKKQAVSQGLLTAQWQHHQQQLALLKHKIEAAVLNRDNLKLQQQASATLTPIYESHWQRFATLNKEELASQREAEEVRENYLRQKQTVEKLAQDWLKSQADLTIAQQQLLVYEQEFLQQQHQQATDLSNQLAVSEAELSKQARQLAQKRLTSPVDGVVHNIQPIGRDGVVQSGELLMNIIPANAHLQVKAKILNKDIGFIEQGQAVQIKLDAFDFTKYGAIGGHISHLSDVAVLDEEKGMVYHALMELDQDWIGVHQKQVNLIPGMTVVTDILTGDRPMADYILAPVMRYKDEVMRER